MLMLSARCGTAQQEQGIWARNVNGFTPLDQQAATSTAEVAEETLDGLSDLESDSDDLDDKPAKKQKQKLAQPNQPSTPSKEEAYASKKKPEEPKPGK
ncbi:hypothetical protein PGT21_026414 [Puccinia graminis f. sp. tritici]|uniref:Uncharacterized protein n=1 Tax=Puccinia graminis f. sp. tritici TaxID=56615 RepID=A0A5B0LYB0_PUCGR|nr:hypothetical protein PGT21_026414 [Puccinia graminis f. sp. tritici]